MPERVGPHRLEHGADRAERFTPDLVDAELRVRARLDETGIGQHFELQRDRAERHVGHRLMNGARRQLLVPEQPQDFAAAGRPDGGEQHGVHGRT